MNTIFFTLKTLTYPFVWEAWGRLSMLQMLKLPMMEEIPQGKAFGILENSSSRLYNSLIPTVGAGYERLLRMIFKYDS